MVQSPRRYWCALLVLACGCQATPQAAPPKIQNESLPLHMFVVRETSICPTPTTALSRECGNSVEFEELGYRLHRGERIEVSGPVVDGVVGSPRYLINGQTPGFVRADDLAVAPDLTHLKQSGLRPTAVLVDLRTTPISLVSQQRDGDSYPVDPPQIRMGTDSALLPDCLENLMGVYYEDIHSCLAERDCDFLNYICDSDYCDSLIIEIVDSDISAIADRYGVFRVRECERYPE